MGKIGAGKTTVVKPLAEALHLVRLSNDDARKLFWERGYDYSRIYDVIPVIAEEFMRKGYSIAIDADCSSDRAQKLIQTAVEKFHVRTVWININPPEEFILNKLRTFSHTWLFKDGEDAVKNYYDALAQRKPLSVEYAYEFDTSRNDLDRQIAAGIAAIEKVLS